MCGASLLCVNRVASQSMAKVGGATPKGKFSALNVCAVMQERLTPKIALSPLRQPAAVCARSWNENVLLGRNGCCGWVEPGSQVTPAAWLFWPGDRRESDECGALKFYERFRWRAGRVIIKYYHTYVRGTRLSIYGLCCLRLHAEKACPVALSIFVCLRCRIFYDFVCSGFYFHTAMYLRGFKFNSQS